MIFRVDKRNFWKNTKKQRNRKEEEKKKVKEQNLVSSWTIGMFLEIGRIRGVSSSSPFDPPRFKAVSPFFERRRNFLRVSRKHLNSCKTSVEGTIWTRYIGRPFFHKFTLRSLKAATFLQTIPERREKVEWNIKRRKREKILHKIFKDTSPWYKNSISNSSQRLAINKRAKY